MTRPGVPTLHVITRALRNTPVPMTSPITIAVAASRPSPRTSVILTLSRGFCLLSRSWLLPSLPFVASAFSPLRGFRLQAEDRASIQRERVERIARRHQQILMSVEHVGLRRVRHLADARVPQRRAVRRVERDDVAARVAAEP